MITLHTLSANKPHSINPADITEVMETRFGGCGIMLSNKTTPVHFWETPEQVLKLIGRPAK